MIMAQAQQKMGMEEPSKPAPTPAPKPAPKPQPAPEPTAKSSQLTPEAQRILAMARGEKMPPAETKTQKMAKATPTPSTAIGAASLKLKVLSGTGKISSAKKMSKTLGSMGYKSEKVDLAPRSNFKQNTVYYAKGFEATANDIKKRLGGTAITKPLSWNSQFDIIVVSVD
jgi:hypothetical protein